jgi:hypothetical protein
MLIDVRELMSEHSGVNMADAVWTTLKKYGIEKCVSIYISNIVVLVIMVNI